MLIHSDNKFSDAQVLTASAASTNYIDTKVLGDGTDGMYIVVWSPTILDSAGDAAVLEIEVQSDSDSGFATNLVTHVEVHIAEADLTAGILAKIHLPLGLQRYVRLNYPVTTEDFTSGTISAAIASGVDNDNV